MYYVLVHSTCMHCVHSTVLVHSTSVNVHSTCTSAEYTTYSYLVRVRPD